MTGLVPLLRRWLPAVLLLAAAGLPVAYAALDLFAKQKAADELLDAAERGPHHRGRDDAARRRRER